jgi:RNA binding exosome subunit
MFYNFHMPRLDATLQPASPDLPDRQTNHGWRMRMLETAAERGLELLEEVGARARERADEGDLGLTYSRISKSIRQSVALHARLEEQAGKTDEQKAAEAAARTAVEARRVASAEKLARGRKENAVRRAVTRAIDDHTDDEDDRDTLYDDMNERLDDADELELDTKPVGQIVAGICRAMRLPYDPALWEDEPWAIAETRDRAEGSPFARWRRTANDDDDDPFGLAETDDDRPRRGVGPP